MPAPEPDRTGALFSLLNGKPASLLTRIDGTPVEVPSPQHCAAVGAALARLHVASMSYRARLSNRRGPAWWRQAARAVKPSLSADQVALLESELKFQTVRPRQVAEGAIHGDLFCDNVLFHDGRVAGIIDFGFAATDFFAYDLATTVNDCCVDDAGSKAVDAERAEALVTAYDAARPLTPDERAAWPALLRAAGLRSGSRGLRPASAAFGRADACARSGAFRARPARSRRAARALSRARFVNDDPREFLFTRYDARHGMAWLAQAYALFSRKRLPWILLLLTYYVLLKLLLSLPFVGPYAITILKPVFAVGLLAAAWTQERGGTPALSQLFQGFRANLKSLLAIGIFFVVGVTAAIFASSLVDDGKLLDLLSNAGTMNDEEVAAALADGALQAGMLFSALLTVPVLIATWWAPSSTSPVPSAPSWDWWPCGSAVMALAVSLRAALANWRPLAIYVLGVSFYGVVLPALFTGMMVLLMQETGLLTAKVLLVPYGIFLAATLHISDYVSYRDVFHAGETLAPLSGPHTGS